MKGTLPNRARFGDFELDLKAGELYRDGRTVLLQEQPFQVLRMLVLNAGKLVTREEIQKKLWANDTVVEFDHGINTAIQKLRQALGDSANKPSYIQTVARRGYRLIAPVGRVDSSCSDEPAAEAISRGGDETKLESSSLIGKTISHFRVLHAIGGGGMGLVYRAEDLKLSRRVAIKFLPAGLGGDPQARERFSREARAASSLDHPNICHIYEFGEHEGRPFIVMQLLEGQTLTDRLAAAAVNRKALPLAEVLDIGIQVIEGLKAAHEKGIIHRDIKPANIFLTNKGVSKILDFGLAKLLQGENKDETTGQLKTFSAAPLSESSVAHLTHTGKAMGTAGYMSPEQVRGEKLDARTDLFSFGVVLYEMAAGSKPFPGETPAAVIDRTLTQPPIAPLHLNPDIPTKLEDIISRALQKDRSSRYRDAAEMRSDLQQLRQASDPHTQLSAPARGMLPVKERASAKKLVWIAAAVAAIVIAAAVIISWRIPVGVPVVEAVTQLTDDGLPKRGNLVTDGFWIYFTEGDPGNSKIAQVSVAGGETSIVPTRLADTRVAGIAPDGSSLLVHVGESNWQLWTLPVPTGEARRLGTITAELPSYLPDGRLLFIQDAGLYVAERDGSNIRKLLTVPSGAACPTASPDGKIIVLVAEDPLSTYFEVTVDGSRFHEIMKGTADAVLTCPDWTPDGKHLIYAVVHQGKLDVGGRSDVWAVAARTGLWRSYKEATQLTNGSLAYVGNAIPSRDGKHIFTIGIKPRGELVRYDRTTKQFVPFLGGIPAIDPSFSRDGQWVAYTSAADHTLWRSRADGTDRLRLTLPPMQVAWPVISQDGRQVAFQVIGDGGYVISTNGGQPRKFADNNSEGGSLSPDGNSIAFAGWIAGRQGDPRTWELQTLNLTNGALSSLRSSQNVIGPFWVNQDTLVAAAGDPAQAPAEAQVEWTKLVSFDLKTGKWTDLVSDAIVNWMPSPDGKYIYYATWGTDPKAMRIRLADRQVETLTSLKNLHRFLDSVEGGTQISVAPDGSPVFTRDIGTGEIYALTVKWP